MTAISATAEAAAKESHVVTLSEFDADDFPPTSSEAAPIARLQSGNPDASRRRFLDDAYALQRAADVLGGLTRLVYLAWEAGGATDSGTFRGECRAVVDGDHWRRAGAIEEGRAVWILPALERQEFDGDEMLVAVDAVAVDPKTGVWKCRTGLAGTLPVFPMADDGLTWRPDPMAWLAAATQWPPPFCILDMKSADAESLLLGADLFVSDTGEQDRVERLRSAVKLRVEQNMMALAKAGVTITGQTKVAGQQ